MADHLHYAAVLDRVPVEVSAELANEGWEIEIMPTPVAVKKVAEPQDLGGMRGELEALLENSDPKVRILDEHHRLWTWRDVQGDPDANVAHAWEQPSWDQRLYLVNPLSGTSSIIPRISYPGTAPPPQAQSTAKAPPAATSDNSQASTATAQAAPASSEKAQIVEKGLPALEVPEKVWTYIDRAQRSEFAKKVAEDLYEARIAYAQRVGWVVAPELELLDLVARSVDDSHRTTTQSRAGELLEARIRLAKAEADSLHEDVELKRELIDQQCKVTEILDEALNQAVAWRDLAKTGRKVLILLTVFATSVVGFLAYLLFAKKLDAWAFPAAVFVLAVFALSPAALLIIERPLKGIDEWMPGGKPDAGQQGGQSASAAGASNPTTPAATAESAK